MIDRTTRVVGTAPRIGRDSFVRVLTEAGSPAAGEAGAGYDAVTSRTVDPSFALAVFAHESQYGQLGICAEYGTKNPGNVRTSRLGRGTVIDTPRGPFVRFDSWADGWADLAARLVDPAFAYAKAGAVTIEQIIPIWAPASDSNTPESYIAAVVRDMGRWEESPTMTDLIIDQLPSPNYDAGRQGKRPDLIIMHTTEGNYDGAVSWLRRPGGNSSTHYIISADGLRIAQLVKESDTAWTAGNYAYNLRSVNIEQEGYAGRGGFSDNLYDSAGALVGQIAKRWGIPLDRQHVIGHGEVPNQDHSDPGPHYDFNRLLARARQEQGGSAPQPPAPPSDTRYFPETGHYLSHGFKAFWEAEPDALAYWGFPISEEFADPDTGITIQWFERARFEHQPKIAGNPYGVVLGLTGTESLARDRERVPQAFERRR